MSESVYINIFEHYISKLSFISTVSCLSYKFIDCWHIKAWFVSNTSCVLNIWTPHPFAWIAKANEPLNLLLGFIDFLFFPRNLKSSIVRSPIRDFLLTPIKIGTPKPWKSGRIPRKN